MTNPNPASVPAPQEAKITERSSITLAGLGLLLGGMSIIAGALFTGLMYLDSGKSKQIDELKATLAPVADRSTELVTQMKQVNETLHELRTAFDGNTSKVVDLAKEVGKAEATLESHKTLIDAATQRIIALEARSK